ncbi:MAG: hypothetical protein ABIF04_08265 [Chloroflexota bacterium]
MTMQEIKVDCFGLAMIVIVIAFFGTALGLANFNPVACPIAGALETAAGEVIVGLDRE